MDYTDSLCTRCALCCDGSIFDDVELSGVTEATTMEVVGLAVEIDEQPLLLQPCTALNGTRCTMYAHRPGCCRTFECRVLQRANAGQVDVETATDIITKTRARADGIRALCFRGGVGDEELSLKERCIEVLSQPSDGTDEEAEAVRAELARAMDEMNELVGEYFL